MPNPFIGEIRLFAGNYAPRGWALCDGQTLSIERHGALFSILGTTYGGDGRTTFALPDLRGRVPLHAGCGPGLSSRSLGEKSGAEAMTLDTTQIPSHSHVLNATTSSANTGDPTNAHLAHFTANAYSANADDDTTMDPQSVGSTGGSQPVPLMQPFLGVHHIIALEGAFPSRG